MLSQVITYKHVSVWAELELVDDQLQLAARTYECKVNNGVELILIFSLSFDLMLLITNSTESNLKTIYIYYN